MDPATTEIDIRILDELGALVVIVLYILKYFAEKRSK